MMTARNHTSAIDRLRAETDWTWDDNDMLVVTPTRPIRQRRISAERLA